MRDLAPYLLGVAVLGALAAYPCWVLLQWLVGPLEFHRVVFRTLEAAALAGVAIWLWIRGTASPGAWGLGVPLPAFARQAGWGFLAGVCMMSLVAVLLLALGVRAPRPFPGLVAALDMLWRGLLVGAMVGLVEEIWFRGGLYTALAGAPEARWPVRALALTSLLYAAVHFVRPDVAIEAEHVEWWSGLAVLGQSFQRFSSPAIGDSFAALAAAGLLLGLLRQRTGGIAACLGMHAGWVSVIYPARKLTVLEQPSPWVGTYDGMVGWLATAVFLAAAAALLARRAPREAGRA